MILVYILEQVLELDAVHILELELELELVLDVVLQLVRVLVLELVLDVVLQLELVLVLDAVLELVLVLDAVLELVCTSHHNLLDNMAWDNIALLLKVHGDGIHIIIVYDHFH